MTQTCDLSLASGRTCGIVAIGRCVDCERAFCGSHQALTQGLNVVPFGNLCSECPTHRAVAADAARQRDREEREAAAARGDAAFRDVLDGLNRAGCPGLQRRVHVIYKPRLFGQKNRRVEQEIEPGWRVGSFWWQWSMRPRSGRMGDFNITSGTHELATAVLRSGEIVLADLDDVFAPHGDVQTFEHGQLGIVAERLREYLH